MKIIFRDVIGFIVVVLLTILISKDVFAEVKISKEGYKDAKWGMSKEQVREAFPEMIFIEAEDGSICFRSRIAAEEVQVGFSFINSKLFRVIILFEVNTTNNEKYIGKFKDIEELLIKKYGEPDNRIRRVSENEYISDAIAISTGEGGYFDRWELEESQITLGLSGDNFTLNLIIMYGSKDLAKEQAEKKKEKSLNDL
ncbi:MAG: hypothetical protein GY853_06095 [PVC group bacterium]|nr:hypothetical protein [PVC group bacterium]